MNSAVNDKLITSIVDPPIPWDKINYKLLLQIKNSYSLVVEFWGQGSNKSRSIAQKLVLIFF